MWSVAKYIVPYGYHQGRCVLKLFPDNTFKKDKVACLDSNLRQDLLTGDKYEREVPLYIESDALDSVTAAEVVEIMAVRDVIFVYRADSPKHLSCKPATWRTVLAVDEAFYEMHIIRGNELIAEPHAAHRMEETFQDTQFEHYYVIPFSDDTEAEAKDFVVSPENKFWKLTKRCFEDATVTELKRMMSDG